MIEIELKFKIPAEARAPLQTKLEALPVSKRLGQIDNIDTYYDTADFACLRQSVFMRIRNQAHLDIKYHEQADPEHIHCTERSFSLLAGSLQLTAMNDLCACLLPQWREAVTIEGALHVNRLQAFVQIKNHRSQYAYERLILCVDHVEGLGDFFEVETCCQQESEVKQAQAALQDFVAGLALPTLCPMKEGYVELWLHAHPQLPVAHFS